MKFGRKVENWIKKRGYWPDKITEAVGFEINEDSLSHFALALFAAAFLLDFVDLRLLETVSGFNLISMQSERSQIFFLDVASCSRFLNNDKSASLALTDIARSCSWVNHRPYSRSGSSWISSRSAYFALVLLWALFCRLIFAKFVRNSEPCNSMSPDRAGCWVTRSCTSFSTSA